MSGRLVLTAGLSVTVDGVHPQVGRAGVKQHLEGLRGCSNTDGSIVGRLEVKKETDRIKISDHFKQDVGPSM